ncbi:MAG: hypothetical protein ACK4YQ_00675 [Phenylobacterium sp.]|uniref:hypothetical protein n=1 Tax=Phenylobacterium sp. TaxID=1871053 RepID=UPI00391A1B49
MNVRPDPAAPGDLRELTYGEHLVIWAMRAFVAGRIDCPVVVREFETACGALAVEARRAFLVFAQQLVLRGRRRIAVSVPGRLALTRDEQQIAALFADAQAGDQAGFDARLAWLIARPPEPPFQAAAGVVAQALAMSGRRLRQAEVGSRPAQARAVAVAAGRSVA